MTALVLTGTMIVCVFAMGVGYATGRDGLALAGVVGAVLVLGAPLLLALTT